jgi:hypothetical protein
VLDEKCGDTKLWVGTFFGGEKVLQDLDKDGQVIYIFTRRSNLARFVCF